MVSSRLISRPCRSLFLGRASAMIRCSGIHGASSDVIDSEDIKKLGQTSQLPTGTQKDDANDGDDEDENSGRWKLQLKWLNNILDSTLSRYRRALPSDDSQKVIEPATTSSIADIALNLHRSATNGMREWSLGDLTFGLYLLSLRHASEVAVDSFHGTQVLLASLVENFIYHSELAKGAYMKNPAGLACVSMLRESNVVKFVDKSSVMRPAYYIAIDTREKLVILGVRGTSSVHDVITDMVSHSEDEVTFDGESVHFGTAKAAEWFKRHEVGTLRNYLEENSGFRLRLVGHSLGGATVSILAMMLRKMSKEELGFCPSIVSAVCFATPPCVSKTLAVGSSNFIRTVVLQDDVIPRICAASLLRLRNEILTLDWTTILCKEGEERKGLIDLIASTMEALSSVQDVARRYKIYASHLRTFKQQDIKQISSSPPVSEEAMCESDSKHVRTPIEELFAPGSLFHIRGQPVFQEKFGKATEGKEGCTLWEGIPNDVFSRIVLSGTFFADHKCDNYLQSLRDTLKGLESTKCNVIL